jgi:hypothetical protein
LTRGDLRARSLSLSLIHGWRGRAGSLTSAPRPATPGEISAPRPATPSDPAQVTPRPGRCRGQGHLVIAGRGGPRRPARSVVTELASPAELLLRTTATPRTWQLGPLPSAHCQEDGRHRCGHARAPLSCRLCLNCICVHQVCPARAAPCSVLCAGKQAQDTVRARRFPCRECLQQFSFHQSQFLFLET